MTSTLHPIEKFIELPWQEIQPHVDRLLDRNLSPDTIDGWLLDWSELQALLYERGARLRVATVRDTTDEAAEADLKAYLAEIYPRMQKSRQLLTEKLLAYAAEHGDPPGLEVPMRGIKIEAELFRDENLPLQAAEQENALRFNKIAAAQTIVWEAEEQTITQVAARYNAADREERREIWDLVTAR
jgi:oligoendopeptidase F